MEKTIPSSLYIHIPYCGSKCSYCDFFSLPACGVPDEYVQALLQQFDLFANLGLIARLETVYFGGGTPSLLSCEQLKDIMERIQGFLVEDAEVTLEVNPESLTTELLETAASWRVNRISMGIQSLEDKVLGCIGRCCTASKARQALKLLADSGLAFCTDFIAGLPGQGDEAFIAGLEEVVAYRPHHISLYSLTVAEGTRLFRQIEEGRIRWDAEAADKQWIAGRDFLEAAGYIQYEVSNFAPPGQESRHNSAYWKQESYIGLGAGGAGSFYCQDARGRFLEGLRYTNTTDTQEYIDFWNKNCCGGAVKMDFDEAAEADFNGKNLCGVLAAIPCEWEKLDQETLAFEYVMLGLRMKDGIGGREYYRRFEKNLDCATFDRFVQRGWMKKIEEAEGFSGYSMTREGLLFLNQILQKLI